MPKLDLSKEQLEYLYKNIDRSDIWILVNEELKIQAGMEAQRVRAAKNYKKWEESKDDWRCDALKKAGL